MLAGPVARHLELAVEPVDVLDARLGVRPCLVPSFPAKYFEYTFIGWRVDV